MTHSPSSLQSRRALWSIRLIATACCLVSAYVAMRYAGQKPLDQFSFRQTQTAVTAYWLQQNGFSFAYETPVMGLPWSVPFEFPVYQWLVALASSALGTGLDFTARLISYAFLFACIFPVRAITRRLGSAPLVFPLFCVLLFASPTYVYWGRSFMIETTALFFTVAAIRHFVDLLLDQGSRWTRPLFVLFASLGLLQKITTALPMLIVLFCVFVAFRVSTSRRESGRLLSPALVVDLLICFGIPVAIGAGWTLYTDAVKQLNVFGRQLTSAELRWWNFGTLEQRLTKPLYRDVVRDRIFNKNTGGYLGLLLIAIAVALGRFTRPAWVLWISLVLGILPILLFANLHLVHDYYECGNLIFFLFALSVALGEVVARHIRSVPILVIAVLLIVAQDYRAFRSNYLSFAEAVYTDADDTEMAVATVLHAQVPADRIFVAFDFDWTSSLSYLSERKSFMMSPLFKGFDLAREEPTRFVYPAMLGAVVACPKNDRAMRQLVDWSRRGRTWKIGLVDDCYVAVPERGRTDEAVASSVGPCAVAAIAVLPVRDDPTMRVVRLRLRGPSRDAHDASYATGTSSTDLHEMLDVTRRTARRGVDRGAVPDAEYTRLLEVGDTRDDALHVYRRTGDRVDECHVMPALDAR